MNRILNEDFFLKGIIAIYCAIINYVYTQFTEVIAVYTIFIIIDFLLGVIASFKKNNFNTANIKWGIINKVLSFTVLLVAMLLDFVMINLSNNYCLDLYKDNYLSVLVSVYLLVCESASIIKNLKLLDIEVPKILTDTLNILKKTKINKK